MRGRPLGECVKFAKTNVEDSDDILNDISSLFPGQCRNLHGDAGSEVIYTSASFGEIHLKLANSRNLTDHSLFAHYLWNASLQLAEFISTPASAVTEDRNACRRLGGHNVLELGAGCGLVGITSALAGASRVTISDYSSADILETIKENVDRNLAADLRSVVDVRGHQWGHFGDTLSKSGKKAFSRILCADCLWMSDQHENLISSFDFFLSYDQEARIVIVAGFHTGRETIAAFWTKVKASGFMPDEIWEQDALGNERGYDEARRGVDDDIEERRKWLCIASVKRATSARSTLS